jgi:hypothetical protein
MFPELDIELDFVTHCHVVIYYNLAQFTQMLNDEINNGF